MQMKTGGELELKNNYKIIMRKINEKRKLYKKIF